MIQFQEYLSSDYPGFASFIDTIIKPIFGDGFRPDADLQEMIEYPDEIEEFDLISNSHDEDFRQLAQDCNVSRLLKLGIIRTSNGIPIHVYDITVGSRKHLARNRKGIQEIIRRNSEMTNQTGAFMLFHYADTTWEWRFSYCYVGRNREDTTSAKRYTYLLGRGQSCKTAALRFQTLLKKKGKIAMDDITEAFSVESVSKEFFDQYRLNYADIVCYVTGKRMVKAGGKWEEKQEHEPNEFIMQQFAQFADPEKAVRDYVKKLMGRLVFLQFIQKKGWLGVPMDDASWTKGDKEFIQHLFAQYENKDNFIDDVLEPLFNDINTRRADDKANPVLGNDIKVPYLNGGLFEKDAEDDTTFPLPAKYMQDMLDFFSAYNFTIDENDPNDAEVGVDPEMLGRVFENLLEDNKDKGAFYTPKEIVQYMCRESLIAYLQTDIEDDVVKQSFRDFVTTHEVSTLNPADVFKVDKKLREVKICDPAIGSGAFPMGLLKELFDCRMAIEGDEEGKTPAEIKKDIIQNSIYGVDIEKGAVDIARLRFWLSLIIDEQTPHALPNMDFKIMQGNSLLEQYKGVRLDNIYSNSGQMELAFDEETAARMLFLEHIYKYFKEDDHDKKNELLVLIDNAVKSLVKAKTLGNEEIAESIDSLDLRNNTDFFLWHTWFNDVFENGGFDIVIGNPPYGLINKRQNQGEGVIVPDEILEIYKNSKDFAAAKGGMLNIFRLFVIHGGGLLKKNGIFCEIFPLAFTCDLSSAKLREHVMNNYQILNIEAFPERDNPLKRVFASAKVSVCILLFANTRNKNASFSLRINREPHVEEEKEASLFNIRQIKSIDGKNYTIPLTETQDSNLLVKIYSRSNPYGAQGKCYTGEIDMTFCKKAFTSNPEDCKMLRGAHVDRYIQRKEISQGETLYLDESILREIKKSMDSKLFSSPRIIMQGITGVNERIRLKMTLVKDTYCANSVNYCLFEDMNEAKYMLGLFNSKLMNYVFKLLSTNSNVNGYEVDNLPVVQKVDSIIKESIINSVSKILDIKATDIFADTSFEEQEIDQLVYKLYNLTPEEIAIVEGKNE